MSGGIETKTYALNHCSLGLPKAELSFWCHYDEKYEDITAPHWVQSSYKYNKYCYLLSFFAKHISFLSVAWFLESRFKATK